MDEDHRLRLRPFTETDLGFLDRVDSDPEAFGPFEWSGFHDPRAHRRRWEKDGLVGAESSILAIELAGGEIAGLVSWRNVPHSGGPGVCLEVGAALLPEHRGHGVGTQAQRALVDYLLRYTTAHRLEAWTEGENLAEQRVLERLGFEREGLLREVGWRDGAWRDAVVYALLRS